MRIDKTNYKNALLEMPSFHDWVWKDLKFEYDSKQIVMQLLSCENETAIVEMVFDNVIAFNMMCCDFWGKSPHIDCIIVIDEARRSMIKQIFSEKEQCDYEVSRLKSEDDYIEVIVSGISGNRFTVVCEYIICDF